MKLLIGLFVFALLFSCKEDGNSVRMSKEANGGTPENITLIFEKRENTSKLLNQPGAPSDVSILYFFSDYDIQHLVHRDSLPSDTIRLKPESRDLLIELTYHQADQFAFLAHEGDTIKVKYSNGMPRASVLNRTVPKYEFSYDSIRRSVLGIEGLESMEINLIFNSSLDLDAFWAKKSKNYKVELDLLDRLRGNHEISAAFEQLLRARNRYNLLMDLSVIDRFRPNANFDFPVEPSDFKRPELLNTRFYKTFLTNYTYKYLIQNKGRKSNYAFIPDSKSAFDSVYRDSTLMDLQVKNHLLAYLLGDINEYFSRQDFTEYHAIFKSSVSDSTLLSALDEKYFLDFEALKTSTDRVALLNMDDQIEQLDGILDKHRGRVVYIDFWASWCTPCRIEMPDSRKLKEEFKDEDVAFVYISIDKDRNAWESAAFQEGLTEYENNYLALNHPHASFFQTTKLFGIPRYMIFDKVGTLVYSNAPKPSDDSIRTVLKKQLEL